MYMIVPLSYAFLSLSKAHHNIYAIESAAALTFSDDLENEHAPQL